MIEGFVYPFKIGLGRLVLFGECWIVYLKSCLESVQTGELVVFL